MRSTFVVLNLTLCIFASPVFAATINVPADQPTIQVGINAALNGDTVLVAPGTYFENIDFMGKAIIVKSSGGSKVTIIDGGNLAPVVTFAMGEGLKSLVSGFTLQHGAGSGVYVEFTSPTVEENLIRQNTAGSGGGIEVYFGSPVIKNNRIIGNTAATGGGIDFGGASDVTIAHNTIVGNNASEFGGGISIDAAGTALIEDNKIMGNTAASEGGGVWIVNEQEELFIQNLIVGNSAPQGGGVYFLTPNSGGSGMLFVNNTIANNDSADGSAIWAGGFDYIDTFWNNLIIGKTGQTALVCDTTYDPNPPIVQFTDAYAASGIGFQGSCASDAGQNGNISTDPLFVSANNFDLQAGSPVIDVGSNSAPDLPKKDFGGKPRIVDGDGDGDKIVDMGAYEFQ